MSLACSSFFIPQRHLSTTFDSGPSAPQPITYAMDDSTSMAVPFLLVTLIVIWTSSLSLGFFHPLPSSNASLMTPPSWKRSSVETQLSSSTSKHRVAFGGICGSEPLSP